MQTRALDTQTTPAAYDPDVTSDALEQHRLRVLIDEVATLRGLTIQMSLRLMALAAAPSREDQQAVRDEFRALQSQFAKNMDMLFGHSNTPAVDRGHVEWIRKTVGENTARRKDLRNVEASIGTWVRVLEDGKTPTFTEAQAFFNENWPVVRDKMTEIIWDLWADLDRMKSEAVAKNTALQRTLRETLADIKKISTTIRMVAINTSVLAARPQEAGAGLKAISVEVKQLSESIADSANRAQDTIAGLR